MALNKLALFSTDCIDACRRHKIASPCGNEKSLRHTDQTDKLSLGKLQFYHINHWSDTLVLRITSR